MKHRARKYIPVDNKGRALTSAQKAALTGLLGFRIIYEESNEYTAEEWRAIQQRLRKNNLK